jgi:hypothetical protein
MADCVKRSYVCFLQEVSKVKKEFDKDGKEDDWRKEG